jgi:hypothetical protein
VDEVRAVGISLTDTGTKEAQRREGKSIPGPGRLVRIV